MMLTFRSLAWLWWPFLFADPFRGNHYLEFCIENSFTINLSFSKWMERFYMLFLFLTYLLVLYVYAKSLQLYLTLWNPVDCCLPGSSVHEILQARTLVWVAVPSSRVSSRPRYWTHVSYLLLWQVGSLPRAPPGKPCCYMCKNNLANN